MNCGICGMPIAEGKADPRQKNLHISWTVCVDVLLAEVTRLRAELQEYKDNPTQGLAQIGYHDVEAYYKEEETELKPCPICEGRGMVPWLD